MDNNQQVVHCKYEKLIDVEELKSHPKNRNVHSRSQIVRLSKLLKYQGIRAPVIVSLRSGLIVKGHGTLAAIKENGWIVAPVVYQNFENEDQEYAFLISDNSIAEWAELDLSGINKDLPDLDPGFDLEMLGFEKFELEPADKGHDIENKYLIFNKEEIAENAFAMFREMGFPYPKLTLAEMKQQLNKLAQLDEQSCQRSTLGYRIADTFHRHRFHAAAINMSSPFDSFLDDKKLRKVIDKSLDAGVTMRHAYIGFMSLVNGTQACANFRPAFARMLYNKYCKQDGTVFDSSTGYGGRLVGFLASHCERYIGTDPNVPTFTANGLIAQALRGKKRVELYNSPIEDLDASQHADSCDLAFTSPPYFVKEIYSEDATQSCQRYKEYGSWRDGFLAPMLQKNFAVLKSGGALILNIEDVKIGKETYPLVKDSIELAEKIGLKFHRIEQFELADRTFVQDGEKEQEEQSESVIFFTK